MGSGQGARLCVWRSRQGLTDTDWTSQLGTLRGLQRHRGSPGAECRRSIQRGVCRGGRRRGTAVRPPPFEASRDRSARASSGRGAFATVAIGGPALLVLVLGGAQGRQRGGPSRRQERCGGLSSHRRGRHGEAAGEQRVSMTCRGWSFKARGLSSKRSPQTPERRMRCAGRGRPPSSAHWVGRRRNWLMALEGSWQRGSQRPGPSA